MQSMDTDANNDNAIDQLNTLLRGEIVAVETYMQALENVDQESVRCELAEVMGSHAKRVDFLMSEVALHGGEPVHSSGLWGTFARVLEGGATVFGTKSAVSMLEEREVQGIAEYMRLLASGDPSISEIVKELLPRQAESLGRMNSLKQRLH